MLLRAKQSNPAKKWIAASGLVLKANKAALCFAALLAMTVVFFMPTEAFAQAINIDLGQDGDGTVTGRVVQLVVLLTVLSLAPSILIMMTSFTRIVVVLSFLRTAIGIQQTPPNTVMISLALFLTFFIMAPTLQAAYETAVVPLINEEIDEVQAFERGVDPFKKFMITHVREQDLRLFMEMNKSEMPEDAMEVPLQVLIPSFMISELRRAFEIGFMLFLPFLIIDLVTASILMSMGMMMLPPVTISLPFKIIFFVLVDGWYLIAGSLIRSFDPANVPIPG
ncbi:MAG: flagellar type III secretion system pore protein FliP [Rhodospirillales bacterium]|nr:flagellar type III secretion system pore protein FliP [Alphaproteobacteria bacterium]USO06709.1 MAG: flagellar type III secretion system pore protein FliP [Rhodospirillales bacterium]